MMNRIRCPWTGFTGGPGLSTFYVDPTVTDVSPLKTFFNSVSTWIPNTVTITIPSTGDVIDPTTGAITDSWGAAGSGTAVGSVTPAAYSAPSGALVKWPALGLVAGRRVVGKTFLVPLGGVAYGNTGTISAGVVTSLQTAASLLATTWLNKMLIWSRPYAGKAAVVGPPPRPARPARAGSQHFVASAQVFNKTIVLRSRRD